jgi:hypothetical protein
MDYKRQILNCANELIHKNNSQINKSNFDKTYIGKVIGSIKDDNEKVVRWQIFANASTFNVLAENCNVVAVGQRVRMFIPSNQRDMVYAEVITDYEFNHPSKVVYDDEKGTVTETWLLSDKTEETRVLTLTIEGKDSPIEEVTAITFPDGSVMSLEGF